MRFAEFGDCRFTDDPHVLGYQNGNHYARGFDHAPIPGCDPPCPVRLLAGARERIEDIGVEAQREVLRLAPGEQRAVRCTCTLLHSHHSAY